MNHHLREPRSAIHRSGSTLFKRACVSCPGETPSCNCAPDQDCVLTSRTCDQCPQIQCNPKSDSGSNSSGKSGVNAGVIAGPVVAVVVLVAISAGLWWLWKRRKARDLAALESFEKRTTLQRSVHSSNTQQRMHSPLPDLGPRTGNNLLSTSPSGDFPSDIRSSMDTLHVMGGGNAQRRVYHGDGNIDLSRSGQHDPFDDGRSVATDQMSFGSTNVIPIAYVPPSRDETDGAQDKMTAGEKLDAARRALGSGFTRVGPPTRPARSPDLDLRLRPANGINKPPTSYNHQELVETLGTGSRDLTTSRASVLTTRTGVSAVPSFMSGSTEFAYEAPQIVTRREVQTGVVQQAAVVDLSANDPTGNGSYGRNLTAIDRRYGDGHNGGDQSPSASSMRSGISNTSDPFSDRRADRSSGNTFGKMLYSTDGHGANESGPLTMSESQVQGFGIQDTSDDLRFSMGSLAMGGLQGRDSYGSTMTGWSVGQVQVGQAQRVNLTPHGPTYRTMDPRESVVSARSEASSFLNAIIPPTANGGNGMNVAHNYPRERLPTNMSANTLDHESRSVQGREAAAGARKALVSTTSEGLSGFDFAFEDGPPLPVQPAQRRPA